VTNIPFIGYFWVAIGGALGSVLRFWFSVVAARHFGESFPWGTVLVNISGSVVIGLFAALTGPEGKWVASTNLRYFVMVGICGGYTTFSSFSLQTLNLIRDRQLMYAGANILLSVVLCLIGVWLGYVLGGTLNHPTR
jgi:CrcB protein